MEAAASAPPWIPEDDLRLKNAMEAGASLEALAKGAIRFSRKFTDRELRERWHSLLYDADISAEASSRMLEFEDCKSTVASKSNSRYSRSRASKRKKETVRKHYYAMQKRLRTGNSYQKDFFDPNFLYASHIGNGENFGVVDHNEPLFMDCNADGGDAANAFHARECVSIGNQGGEGVVGEGYSNGFVDQVSSLPDDGLGDDLIDFANALEEDIGPSHVSADEPLWKTIEDVPAPEMPIDVTLEVNGEGARKTLVVPDDVDGENIGSSQYEVVHSEAVLNDGEVSDELNRSVGISGGDYADIYLRNEDELILMDVNDKESMDKSSYESLNPIPLSSSQDVHEFDVPESCQPQKLVSDNLHTAEVVVAAETSHSCHEDQKVPCSEANIPAPTSVPSPLTPKIPLEEMICTLNTEDPEIPCNDDIIFPTAVGHAAVQPTVRGASELATSTGKRTCDQQMKKEEDSARPFKVPRMIGHDTITENNPNNTLVSFGGKAAHDKNVHADPSQSRSAHPPPKSITNRVLKDEGIEAPYTVTELAPLITEQGSTKMNFPEPEANPSALDCEELEEESDDDGDDDDVDIPCFSDTEQMILEMDLSPHDQDTCISREVFQDEESTRKFIRWEQGFRSFIQRDLASKGAFAGLYGQRVNEYIKKTEVILGRATEDNDVDIDLGKEGLHNKISRRQALIKLEGDGSLSLKNIGKSSIFLNGIEIASGQLAGLSSTNLIEIRGMTFNLETSDKLVKQYLRKTAQNSSPERGP